MANRTNSQNPHRHKRQNTVNFSSPSDPKQLLPRRGDDLIVSLANAYENRRARQVSEWEAMRQHSFPMSG